MRHWPNLYGISRIFTIGFGVEYNFDRLHPCTKALSPTESTGSVPLRFFVREIVFSKLPDNVFKQSLKIYTFFKEKTSELAKEDIGSRKELTKAKTYIQNLKNWVLRPKG